MTTREQIRKNSFIQLKVHSKSESKMMFLAQLQQSLQEEDVVLSALENFRETYDQSKVEIERRARFDFMMVSFIRVMQGLMLHENKLRSEFLGQYGKLLPEPFCPFLSNLLSCKILQQLESYFKNDTRLNELSESVINDILGQEQGDQSENLLNSPSSLKKNIEGYLGTLGSYDAIHRNLVNMICNKQVLDVTSNESKTFTIKSKFGNVLSVDLGQKITLKVLQG